MKSSIIITLLLFHSLNTCFAQERTRLVRANSPKISIKEGHKPVTHDWNWLGVSAKPIVFELEKNKPARKVVFYTDIDSIAFDVVSNKKYPFKVVLNSKDTCLVQLNTVIPTYKKNCKGCVITSDTIPFFLGEDNNIHIKTKVNNTQDLDFIFDTGAGVVCLTAKGYKKSKIQLDGTVENIGFGGTSTEKTSSSNTLEVHGLVWENQSILCLDCQNKNIPENGFDGILGYAIFEDKVVEIDYDKSVLIVHSKMPSTVTSFQKIETRENLFVKLNVGNTKKNYSGWFFFDTGSESNLIVENRFITKSHLFENLKSIGKGVSIGTGGAINNDIVLLPELTIGDTKLQSFPTLLLPENNEDEFYKDGILGNQILKRFNTIIDYPNLTVYLKPNSFINDSFKKKGSDKASLFFGLILALLLLAALFFWYKRRTIKKATL